MTTAHHDRKHRKPRRKNDLDRRRSSLSDHGGIAATFRFCAESTIFGQPGRRVSRMAEVPLDFIGEQLRGLADGQRNTGRTLDDMRGRLQSLETNDVNLRSEVVDMHADIIRMDHRRDSFNQRLTRIECRLDLVES